MEFLVGSALRAGWRAAVCDTAATASVSFLGSQSFLPRGMYTMLTFAAGMYLLSDLAARPARSRRASSDAPALEPAH
ncbi:MAG TPA: hypothetical protein VH969_11335 [Actinophytocola sp.]|uniref:hypothetical protein n=1 Tax=Actinophytocola sp. TaxID=1872138 RepID=UPI002F95A934